MDEMLERLTAPFPCGAIKWRVQMVTSGYRGPRAMMLPFVDARDIAQRLDNACGPAGWQDVIRYEGKAAVCELKILVGKVWISKSDGAGETQVEGEKGSATDAFKRAAVKWNVAGTRGLYAMPNPWVDVDGEYNDSRRKWDKVKVGEEAQAQLLAHLRRHWPPPSFEERMALAEDQVEIDTRATTDGAGGGSAASTKPPPQNSGDTHTARSGGGGERSAKTGTLSDKQRRGLFAHNFGAWEKVGVDRATVNEMDSSRKYAPLNFACGQLGVEKTTELRNAQYRQACKLMDQWVERVNAGMDHESDGTDDASQTNW